MFFSNCGNKFSMNQFFQNTVKMIQSNQFSMLEPKYFPKINCNFTIVLDVRANTVIDGNGDLN